jgi:hypothetical protein
MEKWKTPEPTTGGSLNESQREIFKLLGLNEDASVEEITDGYHKMVNLYKDNMDSPSFIRIRDAYEKLQKVRENLPDSEYFRPSTPEKLVPEDNRDLLDKAA